MNTKTMARYAALVGRYIRIQTLLAGAHSSETLTGANFSELLDEFEHDVASIPEAHLSAYIRGFQLSELVRRY